MTNPSDNPRHNIRDVRSPRGPDSYTSRFGEASDRSYIREEPGERPHEVLEGSPHPFNAVRL